MPTFKPAPLTEVEDSFENPYPEVAPDELLGDSENILIPRAGHPNNNENLPVAAVPSVAGTKAIAERLKNKLPDFEDRVGTTLETIRSVGLTDEYLAHKLKDIMEDDDNKGFIQFKALELAYKLNGGMLAKTIVQANAMKQKEVDGGIHFHLGPGIKISDILMPQGLRKNPTTIEVPVISEDKDKVA